MFDTRMIDPSDEELAGALAQADRVNEQFCGPGSATPRAFWQPFIREIQAEPDGGRYGTDTRRVYLAWWTDHLGRRHVRVTRPTPRAFDPGAPQPAPLGLWPPLGRVYPERVLLRARPGGLHTLLAVCDCGVSDRPELLAWMGDRCVACHDGKEEAGAGGQAAPFTLEGHPEGDVLALAFTADGRTLASVGLDGVCRLWDLGTGQGRTVLQLGASLSQAVPTPQGQILLLSPTGQVWEFDPAAERCRLLAAIPFHLRCAALAPDGRLLIVGEREQYLLLDRPTGATQLVASLAGQGLARAVASPDGLLFTLNSQGTLRRTDLRLGATTVLCGEPSPRPVTIEEPASHVALAGSPDGRWLAL